MTDPFEKPKDEEMEPLSEEKFLEDMAKLAEYGKRLKESE